MQGEHIDYGYTGTTPINREVRNIKDTLVRLYGISFSGKQLLLSTAAVLIFIVLFKITKALNLAIVGVILSVAAVVPLIMLAFVKKHGLDYDTWLLVRKANKKYSSPIRKAVGMNEYEKLEDAYDKNFSSKTKKRKRKAVSSMKAFH